MPRWAQPIGWTLVVLVILANGIRRIYVGAHWPSDVLEGLLIGVAWLTFILSQRWISDRAFTERAAPSREASSAPGAGRQLPT